MQRGSLSCWEAYPVPQSPLLTGDLRNEEYLLEPGAGTVKERSWSPDAIDLDVTLSRPATVADQPELERRAGARAWGR